MAIAEIEACSGGGTTEYSLTNMSAELNEYSKEWIFDTTNYSSVSIVYTANNSSGGCKLKDGNDNILENFGSTSVDATKTLDISSYNTIKLGNYNTGTWECNIKSITFTV